MRMTLTETASALRRAADIFDKMGNRFPGEPNPWAPNVAPILSEEQAAGAGALLCFVRDLVTASSRDTYPREDLLVMLETISGDPEMFPCGIGQLMWQAEVEEETRQ